MKKLLLILMLTSLTLVGFSTTQTKTGAIREGYTMLSQPLKFTAADSINGFGGHHILTGDSLIISISNPQKYLQYHTITTTLGVNSGSGTITVNFYGKTTSGGAWIPIGTDATYTTGATPVTVTGVIAANYNFLRVSYVQSGGTECARVEAFEIKTVNAFPYGATRVTGTAGLTVTGGIVNLNVSSNNAVNIGTGTTTSTVTLGGAGNQTIAIGNGAAVKTVALGSSNTTSVTTLLSGSGGLLLNKDNNQPTNIGTGTSTGLVTIGGGSGTAAVNTTSWKITNAGAASGFTTIASTGAVTPTGGIILPTASPIIWASGGSTVLATAGTDVACANGVRFWSQIYIPYNVTLTGVSYLVGSVGGTDSVVVQLHNSAGVQVATSKKTGANHGAIVGTAAQFQSCAFNVGATPTAYAAVAGMYYISVQFNGTTAKFRAYPIPGSKFIAGSVAGTWDTQANITPGTTFTADKGPILMTY